MNRCENGGDKYVIGAAAKCRPCGTCKRIPIHGLVPTLSEHQDRGKSKRIHGTAHDADAKALPPRPYCVKDIRSARAMAISTSYSACADCCPTRLRRHEAWRYVPCMAFLRLSSGLPLVTPTIIDPMSIDQTEGASFAAGWACFAGKATVQFDGMGQLRKN